MVRRAEAARWARGVEEVARRIAPQFVRSEPRRHAMDYLRGLLAPIERKNGWQLAEAAGDPTPDGVQDFLSRMRWDAEAVRDDLRGRGLQVGIVPEQHLCRHNRRKNKPEGERPCRRPC